MIADQQGKCLRMEIAHRGDYRNAVAGVGPVEINDQTSKLSVVISLSASIALVAVTKAQT
jgi:hypothetical protein